MLSSRPAPPACADVWRCYLLACAGECGFRDGTPAREGRRCTDSLPKGTMTRRFPMQQMSCRRMPGGRYSVSSGSHVKASRRSAAMAAPEKGPRASAHGVERFRLVEDEDQRAAATTGDQARVIPCKCRQLMRVASLGRCSASAGRHGLVPNETGASTDRALALGGVPSPWETPGNRGARRGGDNVGSRGSIQYLALLRSRIASGRCPPPAWRSDAGTPSGTLPRRRCRGDRHSLCPVSLRNGKSSIGKCE